jgi:hypothetical protein
MVEIASLDDLRLRFGRSTPAPISFPATRTGLPDTDKRCICPCEARFAHFPTFFDDLPGALSRSVQVSKPSVLP